jgi:hypothetical protein
MEMMVSVLPFVTSYTDVTKIACDHLMSHVDLCYSSGSYSHLLTSHCRGLTIHLGFVAQNLALEQDFLKVLHFSPNTYHSTMLCTNPSLTLQPNLMFCPDIFLQRMRMEWVLWMVITNIIAGFHGV